MRAAARAGRVLGAGSLTARPPALRSASSPVASRPQRVTSHEIARLHEPADEHTGHLLEEARASRGWHR